MKANIIVMALPLMMAAMMLQPIRSFSQTTPGGEEPPYLRDRGTGIPMSQFGTYVNKGQVLLYPFYEYYSDDNLEYEPLDFGYGSMQEYRGRYRAHEGIMFIGYGISDKLAIEFEAGVIDAKFNKSAQDTSPVPAEINESGLSDVEGQIRYRWNFENAQTPEFFSYFETVFPTGEKNSLIGTSAWEFKLGSGLVKGLKWGTITFRAAVEYDTGEKVFGSGEYALEYLKRVSDHVRLFAMVEGTEDEVALIPEIQWHISPRVFLKANVGFGITSKATDIAPEAGVMFSL